MGDRFRSRIFDKTYFFSWEQQLEKRMFWTKKEHKIEFEAVKVEKDQKHWMARSFIGFEFEFPRIIEFNRIQREKQIK